MSALSASPSSESISVAGADRVEMRFEVVVIPVAVLTAQRSFITNWGGGLMPTSRSITVSGLSSSRRLVPAARFSSARR